MRSSGVAIQFEDVSKCYVRRPRTLKDVLSRLLCRFGVNNGSGEPALPEEIWAVRNADFSIARGETVGIIGNNGAGKSTVLKLIAGITSPTSGRLTVTGRVASLIELGAGFNLDLAGRDNIYLNGAVLGLSRQEVDRHFDDIVAFSGLAEFLDVPVKYYSSGMYARLGFSIAAHVKADVILTDEVLAVGDAPFRRQCLKKFEELKASATVCFVSHDLHAIKRVCTRVLWLKNGRIQFDGAPEPAIEAYLGSVEQDRERNLREARPLQTEPGAGRWGSGEIEVTAVDVLDAQGRARSVFRTFEDLVVRMHYQVNGPVHEPMFGMNIYSDDGVCIHGTNTVIKAVPVRLAERAGTIDVRYPRLPLLAGTYWLRAGVTSGNNWNAPYDVRDRAGKFVVQPVQPDEGLIGLDHQWSTAGPVPEAGVLEKRP